MRIGSKSPLPAESLSLLSFFGSRNARGHARSDEGRPSLSSSSPLGSRARSIQPLCAWPKAPVQLMAPLGAPVCSGGGSIQFSSVTGCGSPDAHRARLRRARAGGWRADAAAHALCSGSEPGNMRVPPGPRLPAADQAIAADSSSRCPPVIRSAAPALAHGRSGWIRWDLNTTWKLQSRAALLRPPFFFSAQISAPRSPAWPLQQQRATLHPRPFSDSLKPRPLVHSLVRSSSGRAIFPHQTVLGPSALVFSELPPRKSPCLHTF